MKRMLLLLLVTVSLAILPIGYADGVIKTLEFDKGWDNGTYYNETDGRLTTSYMYVNKILEHMSFRDPIGTLVPGERGVFNVTLSSNSIKIGGFRDKGILLTNLTHTWARATPFNIDISSESKLLFCARVQWQEKVGLRYAGTSGDFNNNWYTILSLPNSSSMYFDLFDGQGVRRNFQLKNAFVRANEPRALEIPYRWNSYCGGYNSTHLLYYYEGDLLKTETQSESLTDTSTESFLIGEAETDINDAYATFDDIIIFKEVDNKTAEFYHDEGYLGNYSETRWYSDFNIINGSYNRLNISYNVTCTDEGCPFFYINEYRSEFLQDYRDEMVSHFGFDNTFNDYLGNTSLIKQSHIVFDDSNVGQEYYNRGHAVQYGQYNGSKINGSNASMSICYDFKYNGGGHSGQSARTHMDVMNKYLESGDTSRTHPGFRIRLNYWSGRIYTYYYLAASTASCTGNKNIVSTAQTWYSFCFSYDGALLRLWRNSNLIQQSSCSIGDVGTSTHDVFIGSYNDVNINSWMTYNNYSLDRVTFFHKNITQDIVNAFYQNKTDHKLSNAFTTTNGTGYIDYALQDDTAAVQLIFGLKGTNKSGNTLNLVSYNLSSGAVACTPDPQLDYSDFFNVSSNNTCGRDDFYNTTRNITEYDANNCPGSLNETRLDNFTVEDCDYCQPTNETNTTGWSIVSCLPTNFYNETRTNTTYLNNSATCCDLTDDEDDCRADVSVTEYRQTTPCVYAEQNVGLNWSNASDPTGVHPGLELFVRMNFWSSLPISAAKIIIYNGTITYTKIDSTSPMDFNQIVAGPGTWYVNGTANNTGGFSNQTVTRTYTVQTTTTVATTTTQPYTGDASLDYGVVDFTPMFTDLLNPNTHSGLCFKVYDWQWCVLNETQEQPLTQSDVNRLYKINDLILDANKITAFETKLDDQLCDWDDVNEIVNCDVEKSTFVAVAGDEMTGTLTVNSPVNATRFQTNNFEMYEDGDGNLIIAGR